MKLARYDDGKIGIVIDDRIIDVSELVDNDPHQWPPVAMNRLIADFAKYRGALEAASNRSGTPLADAKLLTPVPADELGDPNSLQGRLWVNDELRQDANTRDLVVDIPGMIEIASHIMTLEPGDIIAAGTPAGVGPIKHGDKVKIEFERIGSMTMDVVQGSGGKASIFNVAPSA